jgi:hypothetical protein
VNDLHYCLLLFVTVISLVLLLLIGYHIFLVNYKFILAIMKHNNKVFHVNSSSGLKSLLMIPIHWIFSRNDYSYLPFYPLLSLLETILLRMIAVVFA